MAEEDMQMQSDESEGSDTDLPPRAPRLPPSAAEWHAIQRLVCGPAARVTLDTWRRLANRVAGLDEDDLTHPQQSLLCLLHSKYGCALADAGDFQGALCCMLVALTRIHVVGDHPDAGVIHNNIAAVLDALGDRVQAERHLRQAHGIFLRLLGGDHPHTRAVEAALVTVRTSGVTAVQ